MIVSELKKYIYENNKVKDILEAIGCHHIVLHKEKQYYSCANPNGDNFTAITIKLNNTLLVKDYTRQKDFPEYADIFTLVQYCLGVQHKRNDFSGAIIFVHNLLGLPLTNGNENKKIEVQNDEDKESPLYWFKKIRKDRNTYSKININKLEKEEEFCPYPHISFVREGIMPWTWAKFGLGYSFEKKRTIIPLRYWINGDLLGYNMRTSIQNPELLDIKKYWITPGYPKSYNIYGLWEHREAIQRAGYVVVYEAEKSVLKRDSLFDETGVAISGHTLSQEQVKILIGLNVEIIIAFDKDVDRDYIRYCCENFYMIRRISYIYDENNLLQNKDAPVDRGDEIFKKLFNERIKYDYSEHVKELQAVV